MTDVSIWTDREKKRSLMKTSCLLPRHTLNYIHFFLVHRFFFHFALFVCLFINHFWWEHLLLTGSVTGGSSLLYYGATQYCRSFLDGDTSHNTSNVYQISGWLVGCSRCNDGFPSFFLILVCMYVCVLKLHPCRSLLLLMQTALYGVTGLLFSFPLECFAWVDCICQQLAQETNTFVHKGSFKKVIHAQS